MPLVNIFDGIKQVKIDLATLKSNPETCRGMFSSGMSSCSTVATKKAPEVRDAYFFGRYRFVCEFLSIGHF
jgi:hypothetical protein